MLITWLREFGYPALWLSIFVAAFGVPLPGFLLLLAAGALSALGDFNLPLLLPIAFSAAVAGDSLGYGVGRRLGDWYLSRSHQEPVNSLLKKIEEARAYFNRRGAWAIFLSRFLFLPLGGPMNLLAGASNYPYRRFLLYDFSGQLLGALIPLLSGYFFGEGWEKLGKLFDEVSLIALAFLVAIILILRFVRYQQQRMQAVPVPLLTQGVRRSSGLHPNTDNREE